MSKVFIVNGHQPYAFSEGALNGAFVERARKFLEEQGSEVRLTEVAKGYDVETEVESHLWADHIIMQFPINWMGVPWSFKKYQDEVYTAGMDGRLCAGDGRTTDKPKLGYGTGGTRQNASYLLSVTFNAPKEAFNDNNQWFFKGASVDDLLFPIHQNMRFFGFGKLPTFAAYDVRKNPVIAEDFARFDAHLQQVFGVR